MLWTRELAHRIRAAELHYICHNHVVWLWFLDYIWNKPCFMPLEASNRPENIIFEHLLFGICLHPLQRLLQYRIGILTFWKRIWTLQVRFTNNWPIGSLHKSHLGIWIFINGNYIPPWPRKWPHLVWKLTVIMLLQTASLTRVQLWRYRQNGLIDIERTSLWIVRILTYQTLLANSPELNLSTHLCMWFLRHAS